MMNEEIPDTTCRVCGKKFSSERSLHAHIKAHNIFVMDYYTTFYPRSNLLTGEPIAFKNKKQYFSSYFSNRSEIRKWLETVDKGTAKNILYKMLKDKIEEKNMLYAPSHLELKLYNLPSIDMYKEFFGSYNEVCSRLHVEPVYNNIIKNKFLMFDKNLYEMEILIDTREQQPLSFKNSKKHKLDYGDYTLSGDNYTNTYVDRKSEQDFKSTMTVGFSRFKKEIQRSIDFDSYLYIIIESSLQKVIKNNPKAYHESNLKFIWHRMREITHEFPRKCQFVFSGGRSRSQKLIPKLLKAGKELWSSDIQYYVDSGKLK